MADKNPYLKPTLTEKNPNGCIVERDFYVFRERYLYDEALKSSDGWEQYDTRQDAPYFGGWVNKATRQIMTFAEGDETLVTAPDQASFNAEYADMVAYTIR